MPYKSRESAIAAARKVAAQLDREPDAAPEKRHALATRLETITSRTTPAGWHAHPWNYESDAIERERSALYNKARDVLNQKDVRAFSHRVHPSMRRSVPVEPWAKDEERP